MKIVVFGQDERLGVLAGDVIIDMNAAEPALPATLLPFIELGSDGIAHAQRVVAGLEGVAPNGSTVLRAADISLRAPWTRKRIACAGGNYAEHALGMAVNSGAKGVTLESITAKIRESLWGFWKVLDDVAGPADSVPYPDQTNYFDYESEVAIVIGKRGKNMRAGEIGDYVWGVTLANDWSKRDVGGAPFPMSFNTSKNFDRSVSLGPCTLVSDVAPHDVAVETRVNGTLRQQFTSADMVFSFGEILAFLSRDFTFVPGDIILGGTGAGTAQDKTKRNEDGSRPRDLFLKKDDVVAISSPAIGTLENTVV